MNGNRKEPGRDTAASLPCLEVRDLAIGYTAKRDGRFRLAVENVSFAIAEGEFVCVVGSSGCGKSTILNTVAGLIKPVRGTVSVNGTPVVGPGKDRAVVFQVPALLPWRTVVSNVRYGLDIWKVPRENAERTARAMIELVGLSGNEDRYPNELSGGMQQRVNLARALAADPKLLLLDEPFAALDAQNRETMQRELLRLWNGMDKTALFVTHQIEEAVLLADRVIVLTNGPGRVREIVPIPLSRPRDEHVRRNPAFAECEERIRELIFEQAVSDAV